jgi:DNA invertase Pin-like site-specific DNA recombinase
MQELTLWEKRVLELRAAEVSLRDIAKQYKIKEQTVKNKLNHIYAKAGLVFSPADDRLWRLARIRQFVKTLSTGTEDGGG